MRAARRARGGGSWLRLVIQDPCVRRVVRQGRVLVMCRHKSAALYRNFLISVRIV
jgi:hypothetical protein